MILIVAYILDNCLIIAVINELLGVKGDCRPYDVPQPVVLRQVREAALRRVAHRIPPYKEPQHVTNRHTSLTETARNTGRYPKYVISDKASIMRKGTETAGMQHHSDITHSLEMLLERTYKKAKVTLYNNTLKRYKVKFECNKSRY